MFLLSDQESLFQSSLGIVDPQAIHYRHTLYRALFVLLPRLRAPKGGERGRIIWIERFMIVGRGLSFFLVQWSNAMCNRIKAVGQRAR